MTAPIVKARVRVMLEVDVPSSWGTNCTFEQIRDQASAEAQNMVKKLMTPADLQQRMRLIEGTQVEAIHVIGSKP